MRIEIPNGFTPRAYQVPFMKYLDSHPRGGRAVWVVHRRGGKDLTAMHQTCKMMHYPDGKGTYWHVYPTSEQARRSIWTEFTKDGQRIMEQVFPAPIRKHPKEFAPNAEMIVELTCGSIWRLMGSDRMEVVGAGPRGVVFSEFAVAKPAAWDFVRPMLREREGWAAFISTPRGRNHFYDMWQVAGREAGWWRDLKTLYDTKAYDPDETIAAERREGMDESRIRQEYLCDWTAANVGSVWGDLLERLEAQQRVCEFPHVSKGVYTSWDIGYTDSTAIWFWQINSERSVDVIDYYENHGKPLSHYFDELDRRDYLYEKHWLPHDARAHFVPTGVSILEMCTEKWGGEKVAITPNVGIPDGIQAGRWLLQQPMRIHSRCGEGLDAIREYHYAWDEDKKTFSMKPDHDWSSHGCFVGTTEVLTRNGTCQIMDLPSAGEVLTLCGWKRYQKPRLTRHDAPLVEVMFEDGYSVRCTPDHLFLTASGWKSASDLLPGTSIRSASIPSRNTSRGASIGSFLRNATSGISERFMEMCGALPLARFPLAATSIIGTATSAITGSPTWSVYPLSTTYQRRQNGSTQTADHGNLLLSFVKQLLNGIGAKRAGSGIHDRPSEAKLGRSGSAWSHRAISAVSQSRKSFAEMAPPRNIVGPTARRQPSESDAQITIRAVTRLNATADVWDITVPGVQHFALANGAIAHNSDAFRYLSVVVKFTELVTRKKPVQQKPVAVTMDRSFQLEELFKDRERYRR